MTNTPQANGPTVGGGEHPNELGPMTAAEFRIARERLGLSAEAIAGRTGVHLRTIRRWEHGHSPVPAGISDEMHELGQQAARHVAQLVTLLEEGGEELLTIPREDTDWPAGWWRMIAGRVTDELPNVRIRYPNSPT